MLNIERLSSGQNNAPHTYRYLVATPALAVRFQPTQKYVLRIPITGQMGTGTIRAVRAADDFEVQTVVMSTLFADAVFVNFPRVFLDRTFVDDSPAVHILTKTPTWIIDDQWDSVHPSRDDQDDSALDDTLRYRAILIALQARSTRSGVSPNTWWLAWTACRLSLNMYVQAECVESDIVVRGKVLGYRAVESDWIDLVLHIHPDDVPFTTTEFVYLSTPITHVSIDNAVNALITTYADYLPRVLDSIAPRRPVPID